MSLAWVLMLISLIPASLALAQSTQTVETRIGKLDFEHGVPTQSTVKTSDHCSPILVCMAFLSF
jgi:hypothetical protein